MKKKKMKITDREIMELLGDPISMDILGVIEDETVTMDYIVDKMNEKRDLIEDYIQNMVRADLLKKTDDGYKTSADSFEGKELLTSTDKNNADWIRGFINHMENSLIDNLDSLSKKENVENLYENIRISYSGIYLSEKEAKELNDYISNFLDEKDKAKRKDDPEYKKYYLYNFFFPEMEE